jgi:cobalt-zinc-cadmium resistance protein CzcA
LQQAIDTALKNNMSVKNGKLRAEYNQKLIKSGYALPATNINAEYGQINSFYSDKKIGVVQTFSFPTVYSANKKFLTEEWKSSVLNIGIQEQLLKKQVTIIYCDLVYLQRKKTLLLKNDTLFAEFLDKATLRFNKGESNVLEKVTADNQRGQIALQLSQLEHDMELAQLQFQLLLNSNIEFLPSDKEIQINPILLADNVSIADHPSLQYMKQQQKVAAASTTVEKSKLLPDFTVGYNLVGMRGMGADNKDYNSSLRFQSVQISLAIPIFFGGQKARIRAAKVNEAITAGEYESNFMKLEIAYQSALSEYRKYDKAVLYFENTALKNSSLITYTANKQFLNGEINYLEWVMLINQAISIQSEYIDALKNKNISIAELNSFKQN